MKRFRFLFGFGLLISVLLSTTSCEDDETYSLDDYRLTTATLHLTESGFLVYLDNGSVLFPSVLADVGFLIKDSARVWVNYTLMADAPADSDFNYYARINDLNSILTKGIIESNSVNYDSIGNDPVTIKDYWFTDNRFLSIEYAYGGGGTTHFINLAQSVDSAFTPSGLPLLDFRHNKNKDPLNYLYIDVVSFDLNSLKKSDIDSILFVIRSKGIDGDYNFVDTLVFNY